MLIYSVNQLEQPVYIAMPSAPSYSYRQKFALAVFLFWLGVLFASSLGLAASENLPGMGARLVAAATPPRPSDANPGPPVSGDMMVIGLLGEPTNMLSFMTMDTSSREVSGNFYVSLLRYDKDMEVEPYAAESFEVLEDGLLLSFTLRQGIRWSDGVELTMDDVEFTYNLMVDPNTPTAYGRDFQIVKEFRKTGRYSCEIRYDQPFPRSLSTWMTDIMPRHLLEGTDLHTSPLLRNPISAGPYLMEEWVAGTHLKLRSNPGYFKGKPYIDRLMYRIIPDATTLFLELKGGAVDIVSGLTPQQFLYQTSKPPFSSEFNVYQWLGNLYTYMGYNMKSPLFGDARVRRAISYAIDKEEVMRGALMGQGVSTIGPFKPGTWAYNDKIEDYGYNPEYALELLAEAGWKPGKSGLLERNGVPFSFTLMTNQGNETRIATGIFIQHQLKKIGIEVKLRAVEWAAFQKQFLDTGFFDAVIMGWTLPAEVDCYDVWHTSPNGGLNFIYYSNEEVDSLLAQARSTFDREKRKAFYDRFQEILHEEQPYCFLYVPYATTALHRRFKGIEPAPAGIGHNSYKWWVPTNEQRYRFEP